MSGNGTIKFYVNNALVGSASFSGQIGKPEAEKNYTGIAIASFICGLVGLFYYQIPCGIAALITGIIGLIKYNPEKEKGKWMSITGIVLGSLEILWGILIIMLGIGIFFSALGTM